jgi:hypothetical protein
LRAFPLAPTKSESTLRLSKLFAALFAPEAKHLRSTRPLLHPQHPIFQEATSRKLETPMDHRVHRGEIREDQITSMLEEQSAQVPSSAWLGAALASMATSLVLRVAGREHAALFVGQWAAPFLLIGIYNKMVKQHGSDAANEAHRSEFAA